MEFPNREKQQIISKSGFGVLKSSTNLPIYRWMISSKSWRTMRKRPSTTAADMRQVGPCCATFRGHFTSKSGEFRKSLRRCVAEIMGNNVKYVYIYIYVDNMGYCHPFIQPSIHNRNPNIMDLWIPMKISLMTIPRTGTSGHGSTAGHQQTHLAIAKHHFSSANHNFYQQIYRPCSTVI